MWKTSKKYFLSFIEEAVMNPDWAGYVGGRVEVTKAGEDYASEEIRFFTNKLSDFYRLRDELDFKEVSAGKLDCLRRTLASYLEKT
jgi:hypothetical protein